MKKLLLDQTTIDSLQKDFSYNPDGTVNYITAVNGSDSYRKTFTYNAAGKVASVSEWVKQ